MSREMDQIDAALQGTGWMRGMGVSGSTTWGYLFGRDDGLDGGKGLALRVVREHRGGPSRSKGIQLMIERIRQIPASWYGNEYYDQGAYYNTLSYPEANSDAKHVGGNWYTARGERHITWDTPEALARAIVAEPGRFGMPNDSPHATVHEALQAGEDVQDVLHAAGIPEMITERAVQHEAAADALDVMQTTSSPAEASTGADTEDPADEGGSSPMRGILIVGGILVLVLVVAGVAVGVSR